MTIAVVVLAVVVLLLLVRAFTGRRKRPILRPLAVESRDRYITEWDRIETRFIDAPEDAVREADAIVMSVLRERGHPLGERDLPNEVRQARREAVDRKDKTEGMRQAMLHYRAVMERMIGTEVGARRVESERREMA
ncbi:MAG TPA: hypothetical protein VNF26_12330 [Candidatus Baltobacterales bacterium]|nr:hypothetical protein [Candidatus Baltobacterales bacterium]